MIVSLCNRVDDRGSLVAIEGNGDVKFTIKRVYYIYGVSATEKRGMHAHKQLQQLMICISGGCTVILDDGAQRNTYRLEDPSVGLLVERMVWREMSDFTTDAVLLVLASRHYEADDYIHDYDLFLREVASRSTSETEP